MSNSLEIIKIGGNVLNSEYELKRVLEHFAGIQGLKILVHGGGRLADQLCSSLGIEPKMTNGRRITDSETLDVVTMAYAGLINKKIVSQLQALDCNAIGLTGADANVIRARKRPVGDIDYGFAGDIHLQEQDASSLKLLLKNGMIPVVCSITHDKKGQLLNTNADTIASVLASQLADDFTVNLTYCFEKEGVLANPENEKSIIKLIDPQQYRIFKETGIITQGMVPKLDNAFDALNHGVESVTICGVQGLISLQPGGTQICLHQK